MSHCKIGLINPPTIAKLMENRNFKDKAGFQRDQRLILNKFVYIK